MCGAARPALQGQTTFSLSTNILKNMYSILLKCKVTCVVEIYVKYYVIRTFHRFVFKRKSEIYNLNLKVYNIRIVRYIIYVLLGT